MDRETLLHTIAGPADGQDARDPDDFDLEAIAEDPAAKQAAGTSRAFRTTCSGQPSRSTRGLLLAYLSWARRPAAQELC